MNIVQMLIISIAAGIGHTVQTYATLYLDFVSKSQDDNQSATSTSAKAASSVVASRTKNTAAVGNSKIGFVR